MNEYESKDAPADGADVDPFADMRASKPWLEAIADAEKAFQEYQDKCDNIDKLYSDLKTLSGSHAEREMQIFWANLEVLKPSIYARQPVPICQGRFKNQQKDKELIRHASEVVERSLITSFDMEDIHESLKLVRDDLATNARGVLWCRLEEDADGKQRVCYDHIDRKDFVHKPARKWKEVGWVARKTYLTVKQVKNRFPEADTSKMEFVDRKGDDNAYSNEKTACVYEIWSKEAGAVVWVAKGLEDVLDIMEPFLKLEKFYPCPRPTYGTLQRNTLIPVPDFVYYKDQIEEINEMTARISALSEALRMKGFYAGGNEDIASAIETALKKTDNNALLIPVPNMAVFGGQGMKDAILWMPVDQVAAVITQLIALRKQLIEDVYQITGLSDIMRGSTDPNETLGSQQLKTQFGSVRIRERQEEMIRLALDAARIAGEIMAENFSAEELMMYSQYQAAPSQAEVQQQIMQIDMQIRQAMSNPQVMAQAQANPEQAQQLLEQANQQKQQLAQTVTIEAVIDFLKNERLRPFVLQIETDSTIQADEDAAKQRTTEFLTALSTSLGQLAPMVQSQPQTAEFAGEVIKFAVAPFRAGRQLEAAIDNFVEQMKGMSQQDKPDPEAEKIKAEQERAAQKHQMEMDQGQQEHAAKMDEHAANLRLIQAKEQQMNQAHERDMEGRKTEAEAKRVESGMPPDDAWQALAQGQVMSAQQMSEALQGVMSAIAAIQATNQQQTAAIAQIMAAPTEIVRDKTGRAVGARKVMNG